MKAELETLDDAVLRQLQELDARVFPIVQQLGPPQVHEVIELVARRLIEHAETMRGFIYDTLYVDLHDADPELVRALVDTAESNVDYWCRLREARRFQGDRG